MVTPGEKSPAKRATRRAPAAVKAVAELPVAAEPAVQGVAKAKSNAPVKTGGKGAVKPAAKVTAKVATKVSAPEPEKAVAKPAPRTAAKSPAQASRKVAAKSVAKPAAQVAVKTAVKATRKAPAKAAPQAVVKKATKVVVKAMPDKAVKAKKTKMVRDSFTIPKPEYDIITSLKQRAGKLGNAVKKSELIRAGIKALASMADAAYVAALKVVPTIKTGRPTKR